MLSVDLMSWGRELKTAGAGSKGCTAKEIDDLIVVFNYLDENKLINELPKYVTENPVNILSNKRSEGDLSFLTERMVKLEATILDLQVYLIFIQCFHWWQPVSGCFAALRQLRQIRNSVPMATFQSLVVALVLDYRNSVLVGLPIHLVNRLSRCRTLPHGWFVDSDASIM